MFKLIFWICLCVFFWCVLLFLGLVSCFLLFFLLFFPVCFLFVYFYVVYLLKLQDLIILCFGEMLPTVSIWRELCSNSCLDILLPMLGLSSADMWWVKLNIRWPHSWPNWPRPFLLVLPKRNHSELSSCHVGMWRTTVCRKTFVADLQSATVLKAGLTQLRATHKTLRCLCIWPRSVVTSPRCAGADCSPREPLALRTAAALQRDDEFVGT